MPLITNVFEILSLSDIIQNATNLQTLQSIYKKKCDYNHPQINYVFGVSFFLLGDKQTAKKCFLKGASYGINFPCELYNHTFIDSIGQCFSLLVTQYPIGDIKCTNKGFVLGYLYLSRCIELLPREAQDSYKTRANLFKHNKNPMIVQNFIFENLGYGFLIEPFIISDYFFSSQATNSPYQNCLQNAKIMHQNLDDITINSKDADEYSLYEMAEIGEQRHNLLYKIIEQKHKDGELNMTINELQKINS